MATVFEGVPDWPQSKERDPRFDNEPPLQERLLMEFVDDLDREGITARVQQLIESAAKVPAEIADDTVAGKVGDLCKLARDVDKRVADAREKHNRPLLDAQRALKSKADGLLHPLLVAISDVRTRLNAYMAEQARIADEKRRKADEEARRIREEQERAAREAEEAGRPAPEPMVHVEPVKVAEPVARGDLGARVGTRTVWHHEIESVRQLPDRLLKHQRVIDALNQVVAAEIRGGCREIKGVRIWSADEAVVR